MATKRTKPTLREDHYKTLQLVLRLCNETQEYLQGCKSCFLDVEKEADENEQQAKIASAIKHLHFPNKP